MDLRTIVIGGDHYNTLWIVRSLGYAGVPSDAIVLNNKRTSFVCKSKYLRSSLVVNNEHDMVEELIKRKVHQKQVILSSSDVVTEILDRNYDQLKDAYIMPNCSGKMGLVNYWMNKANMLDVAKGAGINIPQSLSVHLDKDCFDVEYKRITYPCLIKPQTSIRGHKEDFRICYSRQELEKALDSVKNSCSEVLIQEYIRRDYEFVVNGVRYGKYQEIPGVIKKVKVGQKLNNMGMTTIAFSDNRMDNYIDVELIKKMMDKVDYNGIYSAEFIVSEGIPYLLEVNFRSDATIYISTTGGVNLPAIWCHLAVGHNTKSTTYKKRAYGMAEISYMKELPLKTPWKIIIDWWRTDCYSIFSWKDIKPFFYKFIYAI